MNTCKAQAEEILMAELTHKFHLHFGIICIGIVDTGYFIP